MHEGSFLYRFSFFFFLTDASRFCHARKYSLTLVCLWVAGRIIGAGVVSGLAGVFDRHPLFVWGSLLGVSVSLCLSLSVCLCFVRVVDSSSTFLPETTATRYLLPSRGLPRQHLRLFMGDFSSLNLKVLPVRYLFLCSSSCSCAEDSNWALFFWFIKFTYVTANVPALWLKCPCIHSWRLLSSPRAVNLKEEREKLGKRKSCCTRNIDIVNGWHFSY